MMNYDEEKCVRCGNCATECENGGIQLIGNRIVIDESRQEDWALIAEICPVGALQIKTKKRALTDKRSEKERNVEVTLLQEVHIEDYPFSD